MPEELARKDLVTREEPSPDNPKGGPAAGASGSATDEPSGRNMTWWEDLRGAGGEHPRFLLPLVVNCVADILESEDRRDQLAVGSTWIPSDSDSEDLRSIVRQGPDGAWVMYADSERFPLLFALVDADRAGTSVTEEQWQAARLLALQADLAKGNR